MEAVRSDDPRVWLDAAGPLLAEDEARHNLLFGLADTLARQPARYPSWHLWTVRAGDEVVGAIAPDTAFQRRRGPAARRRRASDTGARDRRQRCTTARRDGGRP